MVNRQVLQNGPQWGECSQWDASNLDFYNPVSSRSQDHFASDFPASTSRCQNRSAMTDDFPHLDIINDLLDDANGIPKPTKANTSFHQSFSNPHHLNRQFPFPMDIWMSNVTDPTSSSSFEGRHDDCFQHVYQSMAQNSQSRLQMGEIRALRLSGLFKCNNLQPALNPLQPKCKN
ncbi:hypothetical protein Vadar_001585 [Vaccinium darrowii]|uniref:Uncharacterized protein n=1 Tax=Vaccinium darrowii TaxID=229202 RepID=A0ACB7YS99_9ERIC|nr:hypothetical protein Vadar_001585 [Vaccinium darrowii]